MEQQQSTTGPSDHPFAGEFSRFRWELRSFLALEGVARLGIVVLAAAAILIGADYFLDLSASVRTGGLVAVVALAAERAWRWVVQPLRFRLNDQQMAQVLERMFESLDGRLLAAVELAADPAEAARQQGQYLIDPASDALRTASFGSVMRWRLMLCEWLIVAGVLAVAGAACMNATGRELVSTGVSRLLSPGGSAAWPRKTHLAIDSIASKVPRGDSLTVRVHITGDVPANARLRWRSGDKTGGELTLSPVAGQAGVLEATFATVIDNMDLIACGGDGVSERLRVVVTDRPRVEQYAAHVVSPAYTRIPPADPRGSQIAVLAGSDVQLVCTANKLLVDGCRVQLLAGKEPVACNALSIRGSELAVRFKVAGNLIGRLDLVDADGFHNTAVQEFQVMCRPDAPPVVAFVKPKSDRKVAPNARIDVAVLATDDFSLASAGLRYRRQGPAASQADEREIALNEVDHSSVATSRPTVEGGPLFGRQQAMVGGLWDLKAMNLQPGDRLSFYAVARDYRFAPGEFGRTADTLHIEVATTTEVSESIYQWQVRLSGLLQAIRDRQQSARASMASMAQPGAAIDPATVLSVQISQEEVQRQSKAAHEDFARLVEEVYSNRLTRPDLEMRLRLIGKTFAQLVDVSLPGVRQSLAAARTGQSGACAKALAGQDDALAAIDGIVGLLREWADVEFILMRLRNITAQQDRINQDTKKTANDLFGKELAALAAESRSLLTDLSGRQAARRDEVDLAMKDLQRMVEQVSDSQATFCARVTAALGMAQKHDLVSKLDAAAKAIEGNRCASIVESQDQALAGLKELADRLAEALKPELGALPGEAPAGPIDMDTLMTQMEQVLRQLVDQERKVLAATQQVDGARPKEGRLPRDLAMQLAQAAVEQGQIETKAADLMKTLKEQRTLVFTMVMGEVIKDMAQARKMLTDGRSNAPVQTVEEGIIAALLDMVAAAQMDMIVTDIKHVMEERFPGRPPAELTFVEDIRMLMLLQAGLNRKTIAFDQERDGAAFDKLSEDHRARLDGLGARQLELAELGVKIKVSANVALETQTEKLTTRPDLEAAIRKASGSSLPIPLMREVAGVITKEHESGRLVQRNQKIILEQLDAAIKSMISMVQAVSDMPDQPPAEPSMSGMPDVLRPSPDLTHLMGGPAGDRSQLDKRLDAEKAPVWGNLPPRVREAILQGRTQQFVGRYSELIRAYYRTLSEAGQK